MNKTAIHIDELSIRFGDKRVFDAFNLHIPARQHWAILGRSGIGKSTLLYAIADLLHSDAATISGRITDASGESLQGKIAWLSQKDSLLPWLSVRDNVILSTRLRRPFLGKVNSENIDKAQALLRQVGLADFADKFPETLSGGQRQRVALARTLFCARPIVLMDEPFSALDAVTKLQLQDLTAELLMDKTVLLITHDPLEALRLVDVIGVLHGQPATLSEPVTLTTSKPRDVQNRDVLTLQGQLLETLRHDMQETA